MSCLQNEALLESIYDEVWEEYRLKNNLTDDQLYTLEQTASTITQERFNDLCY